jgi:hypothetical protein
VADKTTLILLGALRRASAEPGGLPLHSGRSSPGLFPPTPVGKQLAQRSLDEGLLEPSGEDPSLHALTEKGLEWLLTQTSPRQVLDDMVRALEDRQAESAALLDTARRMHGTLEGLNARVEQVLRRMTPPPPPASAAPASAEDWQQAAVEFLERRQAAGASEDCPLPELYREARQSASALTIGSFHDGLRRLHDAGQLYLHPWTGPLYALPEPPFALLVGHEIAYYASPRRQAG